MNKQLYTDLSEYSESVERFRVQRTRHDNICNAVLGIIGESGELMNAADRNQVADEIGDILFYIAWLICEMDDDLRVPLSMPLTYPSEAEIRIRILANSAALAELEKKALFPHRDNEPRDGVIYGVIIIIVSYLGALAHRHGFTIEDAMLRNYNKLAERHDHND